MSLRTTDPTGWPALLRAGDIGEILDCSDRSAQRKIAAGTCGAFIEIDGRHYVRREVFLAALREREHTPEPACTKSRFRRRRRR